MWSLQELYAIVQDVTGCDSNLTSSSIVRWLPETW